MTLKLSANGGVVTVTLVAGKLVLKNERVTGFTSFLCQGLSVASPSNPRQVSVPAAPRLGQRITLEWLAGRKPIKLTGLLNKVLVGGVSMDL